MDSSNCTGDESGEPTASRHENGDITSTVFANTATDNSGQPRSPGNVYGGIALSNDDENVRCYAYSTSDNPTGARNYLQQKVLHYNAELQEELPGVEVYVTKIVTPTSAEHDVHKTQPAIEAELLGLLQNNAVEFVLKDSVPHDANVICTRIVLALKNYGTIDEVWKARLIIQGCLDDEAAEIVSDSAAVASFSVRIVLFLSVLFELPLYVVDAAQAYLQSHNISRIIFARLPKEFRCRLQGWLFRILKPVYGIKESGAYWFDRYIKLWYSIGLISSVIDICLMFRHGNGHLDGAAALMTDDTLLCISDLFRREVQDMHQSAKIKLGKRPTLDEGPLRFGGTHIRRWINGLQADQAEYVSSLADKSCVHQKCPT
jgi:Reverse transcriptase (RNA-dependent DNA polymerase)